MPALKHCYFGRFLLSYFNESPDPAGTIDAVYSSGAAAGRLGRDGIPRSAFNDGGDDGFSEKLKMQEVSFEEGIESIFARDSRYQPDAYRFVRTALEFTKTSAPDRCKVPGVADPVHVTGQELLAGIRAYALEEFGPMVVTVLGEWGVTRCEDFGEVVFNMIDAGMFAKTDKDSREDFQNGYTFEEAFRRPFLP